MNFNLVKQAYAQAAAPDPSPVNLGEFFTLGVGGEKVMDKYGDISKLVDLIVRNLMIAGGLVFFVLILYSGFKFIEDTEKGKETAKNTFKYALIGFIVMFTAYWIVQIIKLITGADIRL